MANPDVVNRFAPRAYESDVERLCAYIKNDSVIRWYLGCSQAAIDHARAALDSRQYLGESYGYLPPGSLSDELAEERQRLKRAQAGNRAYLRAVKKARA